RKSQRSRKPNSVHAFALALTGSRYGAVTTIPLFSPSLAKSSDHPGGLRRAVCPRCAETAPHSGASLFGLAPCGVLPATDLTAGAVRSYRTFSPLPASAHDSMNRGRKQAVCFLCHFPSGRPDRMLSGALPCGVRTFLPPPREARKRAGVCL